MMHTLAVVNNWVAGHAYVHGNVVAFNNIDYRAQSDFTSVAGQTPNTQFGLWDRVNNNARRPGSRRSVTRPTTA